MDTETRDAIQAVRHDVETVRSDVEALRTETRAGFRAVDERFAAVDRRFDAMDRRFDAMDRRFDAMDANLHEFRRDIVHQFGVIAEGLRDQIRIIAEGVVTSNEAVARVRAELDELRRR